MRGGIFSGDALRSDEEMIAEVAASDGMVGASLVTDVTTAEPYVVPAKGEKRFTVAALDLGIKANTPRMMSERGIEVHVLPASATFDEVLDRPTGVLSNGPVTRPPLTSRWRSGRC